LIILYNEIKKNTFMWYRVDPSKIEENIQEFEKLSVENIKRFLVDILEQNALYLNYSEIGEYNIIDNKIKNNNNLFYK
jgi:adenine-specific DNA-methyltransferase